MTYRRNYYKKYGRLTGQYPGIPQGYDYIIYKEGDMVIAKNGRTGAEEFESTDAASVIQGAHDALPDGGVIYITSGVYNFDSEIVIRNDNITVKGSGWATQLKANTTIDSIIRVEEGVLNAVIKDIYINGNNMVKKGIDLSQSSSAPKPAIISNVQIEYCERGIDATNREDVLIEKSRIGGCDYDVYVGTSNGALFITNRTSLEWAKKASLLYISNSLLHAVTEGAKKLELSGNVINVFLTDVYMEPASTYAIYNDKSVTTQLLHVKGGTIAGQIYGKFGRIHLENPFMSYDTNTFSAQMDVEVEFLMEGTAFPATDRTINVIGKYDIIWTDFYTIKSNRRKYGMATFSGDGSTTQFKIAHGLAWTPAWVMVIPASADATGEFYVGWDQEYIYVNYKSAPPSGTDNVKLLWYAEMWQ